mmetsp:Transcript_21555/g.59835  ORF Transcript_21555/g.59835 Transcript_21555/m.59835 type:complete len:411 (+) Transcript_21555:612-1844(+)
MTIPLQGLRAPGAGLEPGARALDPEDGVPQGVLLAAGREGIRQGRAAQAADLGTRAHHLPKREGRGDVQQSGSGSPLAALPGVREAVGLEKGLARGEHRPREPAATRVDPLARGANDHLQRHVHHAPVDGHHRATSEPRHGPVHRVQGLGGAEDPVVRVGLHRPHSICGIDVLDGEGQLHGLEAVHDLVLQPGPHVRQLHIAACVALPGALHEGVAAALRHDHDGKALPLHDLDQVREQLRQRHVHLGQEAHVHVPGRQDRLHGDPAAVPAHQLHQADAVGVCSGLHVCRVDGLHRLCTRSVKAKASVQHLDVVVDRLRHADDGTLVTYPRHLVEAFHCPLVRAIPAEHEELPDIPSPHHLRYLRGGRIAAIADQDAAPKHVDVLHDLLLEIDPFFILGAPIIAAADAIH